MDDELMLTVYALNSALVRRATTDLCNVIQLRFRGTKNSCEARRPEIDAPDDSIRDAEIHRVDADYIQCAKRKIHKDR